MPKNLRTLIKIAQFELDERRRELVEIQAKQDKIFAQINELEESIQYELSNVKTNQDAQAYINGFVNGARVRQENLREEAKKFVPEIEKKMVEVSDKFTEVKKFETVLESKLEAIAYDEQKKKQLELDEIALQKHLSITD